jgi:hypothetical protein
MRQRPNLQASDISIDFYFFFLLLLLFLPNCRLLRFVRPQPTQCFDYSLCAQATPTKFQLALGNKPTGGKTGGVGATTRQRFAEFAKTLLIPMRCSVNLNCGTSEKRFKLNCVSAVNPLLLDKVVCTPFPLDTRFNDDVFYSNCPKSKIPPGKVDGLVG